MGFTVESLGLPIVRTFVPSGYTAPRPISPLALCWSTIVVHGVVAPHAGCGFGFARRSNDALEYGPPGYWWCCATKTVPRAESEWHDQHGPSGARPLSVRSTCGFESPR